MAKYKVGDRIGFSNHSGKEWEIIEVIDKFDIYKTKVIKWTDPKYIGNIDNGSISLVDDPTSDIVLINPQPYFKVRVEIKPGDHDFRHKVDIVSGPKCECGACAVRSPRHSSWCALYKGE